MGWLPSVNMRRSAASFAWLASSPCGRLAPAYCLFRILLHRITVMSANLPRTRLLLALAWLLIGLLVVALWLSDKPSIQIDWQTETEFDSAGFNLLRSRQESGPYVKLNERLIPASDDAAAGADYTFVDANVSGGQQYFYQLEDVDFSGAATRHSAIAFVAPDRPSWLLATGFVSLLVSLLLVTSAWSKARQGKHS